MSPAASTAYERIVDALRDTVPQVKDNGRQATANCPAHEDRSPSLSVRAIEGQALVHCHAGCHTEDVLAALNLSMSDLFDEPRGATYRYDDGRIVHRTPDKKFRQTGAKATKQGTQLYRLAKVREAVAAGAPIYLVEGEKDVHALEELDVVATTSPMGAGNWDKVDPTPLAGAHVVVIPDRDPSGWDYVNAVILTLRNTTASIALRLPKTGKDAADHVAAGYGIGELIEAELPEPTLDQPLLIDSWLPVDLAIVLDGTWKPALPTVGSRRDGVGLFYPGKTHTVSSESEAGKTWLALSAAIDELLHDRHVVYIDFEDDEGGVVSRLLALQISPKTILNRFHYIRPADPLGTGLHLDTLANVLTTHHPTLAIIDGITEAMGLHGLNPLDNADVATFGRILPRRIASTGAAVVCLDHVTKSVETRGRYAIGGAHKLNGLDGAAYLLESRAPFGIGITGRSTIRIAKDRPGRLRAHALPGQGGLHWFGDLVLTSTDESFAEVEIEPPHARGDDFQPTILMAKLAKIIEKKAGDRGLSLNEIQSLAGGNAANNRRALVHLRLDGYVTDTTPHKTLRPYSTDEELS
jgi:hypothetical protein